MFCPVKKFKIIFVAFAKYIEEQYLVIVARKK
jgi:hypothetical protein